MDIKNLSALQIHKLSPEQYKREFEANRLDENALYLVEGDNNIEADWNASEGEAGYIKNRTHWIKTEIGDIVPRKTITLTNSALGYSYMETGLWNIVVGKEYSVFYNGTEYVCTASENLFQGVPCIIVGNNSYLGGENTGEPFIAGIFPGNNVSGVVGLSAMSLEFGIVGDIESIHKLDDKFINRSDWNASEGEAGYIKNRTHYEEKGIILLPETQVEFEDAVYVRSSSFGLQVGVEYIVTYNGIMYSCIGYPMAGLIAIGNTVIIDGENDNGKPFAIVDIPSQKVGGIFNFDGSTNATISITGSLFHKIDKKFLPETVGENVTGKEFIIDDNLIIANVGAEIFNDYTINVATGDWSHAEGQETIASGNWSHAEGYDTIASGDWSHAEGYCTSASGLRSHAEGYDTSASGESSHAEGLLTVASGSESHAEGYDTIASGNWSHAEGYDTIASGDWSHAEGRSTVASGSYQHVQGKYNISNNSNFAHIVGNGEFDSARSNAHTLDWEGNAWFQGDVYVGSTGGTNRDTGSKKLATEEFVNLLYGNLLPVDELTDSYAKVRPLLLSDADGEVSLNPSGISLNNTTQVSSIQITPTELELLGSDSTIHISPETLLLSDAATDVQMSSSGVFLEKNDNNAYDSVSLTSSGLSATSEYDTDILTVISGTTGISLSDASDIEFKTIDLNYNGLSINNNSQTLTSLDAINGLRLIDMDNAKSIILSHEVMFIDRGLSSMRLDEDEFSLTKTISETNENKTTLTPSSLNLSSLYGNLTVSIPNAADASPLITTGQSPLKIQAANINLEGIVNINGAGYISLTPTANNSIVNKAYVDEKTSNLTALRVIIYQDDGTNTGNYNPAYGTFVVENEISTDLDNDGNSIYTVTFDEEEAGINAASIDFTGSSYVNASNVQNAIDILSTRISSANEGLTQLSSTVNTHTTNINDLDNTVASHTSSINSMNTTMNSHTTTINSHTTSINSLQTQINNLVTDVWAIGSTPPTNGKLLWIDTNTTTGGLKYLPTGSTNTATNWKHIPVAWT